MPSPHNPTNDKSSVRREQVIQLLQDGVVTTDPNEDCLASAAHLQQLGLIDASTSTFVWCANPQDADYSESDHFCRGRIDVPENLDESFEDFYCPECDRPVFPDEDEKQQHREMRCEIVPGGILSYLKSLLERARLATTSVCEGVMRVDVGPLGVFVCVVDTCQNRKFTSSAWAATQPTCYVLVNGNAVQRYFGSKSSRRFLLLADVICGQVDFATAVRRATELSADEGSLQKIRPTDDEESASITIQGQMATRQRQFAVTIGDDCVWIEGLKVIGRHAGPRLEVFRLLWELHVDELRCRKSPQDYRSQPVQVIQSLLESRMENRYPDEMAVRRMINRVQTDIENAVRRKLGLPIDRNSIIQICRWRGQSTDDYGFRLNPFCVLIAAAPVGCISS